MRILLAHNHYNPIGGAEVFYHEVGRVLQQNGHEVAYFSPNGPDIDSEWKSYFPKTVDYKSKNKFKSIVGIKEMIYSSDAKKQFVRLLDDFKPDIVHTFSICIRLTPSILDACRTYGVPTMMSCNDYKHICPNYKLYHHGMTCEACKDGAFYHAITNRCAKNSLMYSAASALEAYIHNWMDIYRKNITLFLFASEFMAKKTESFWGRDSFRWDMLKNPFESKKYPLSAQYENYCLYFGRLIDEKGVDILIKAMKHIPKCHLKIIGNGPDEENYRRLTDQLDLQNVEFLGPKWGEELDEVLKKTRFIIVPSIWYENFPYVILQSFAWGKAVIGSNMGGIPELVLDGKYGFIYDALNERELAEKIALLWNDEALAVRMGESAKIYMDTHFNDEVFYENIMRIYKKVKK
jgi:glycosyltransferase involved in cell wall biosynthesis